EMGRLDVIQDGAIVVSDGLIHWVGRTSDLPPIPPDTEIIDASGKIVFPGFIDSHTHLVFAGSREDEFEQRLQGRTYEEIAAAGSLKATEGVIFAFLLVRCCLKLAAVA